MACAAARSSCVSARRSEMRMRVRDSVSDGTSTIATATLPLPMSQTAIVFEPDFASEKILGNLINYSIRRQKGAAWVSSHQSRLDAPDPRRRRLFFLYLECAQLAGVCDMRAAAEFY